MHDSFAFNGSIYDFRHLSSFTVAVPAKQPGFAPAKLVVTFSHHVFTEEWNDNLHTIDMAIIENGEKRAFCLDRYNWSRDLAAIIRYHAAGRAFKGRDRNGVWNNFFYEQQDGRANPYAIYFRIGKAGKITGVDGILHVISAYENPALAKARQFQSIKFETIINQQLGFRPEPTTE